MSGGWLGTPRAKSEAPTLPIRSTKPSALFSVVLAVGLALRMAWAAVVLPFRLIVWVLALLGRLAALAVGFSLMVLGAALLPSSLFFVGLPVFGLGLVMTLRSVE